MLLHAVKDLDPLDRFHSQNQDAVELNTEALFTDDCAFMFHREDYLQTIVNKVSEAQHCITNKGPLLKNVESFKYLASEGPLTNRSQQVSRKPTRHLDISGPMSCSDIPLQRKLKVYNVPVLLSL